MARRPSMFLLMLFFLAPHALRAQPPAPVSAACPTLGDGTALDFEFATPQVKLIVLKGVIDGYGSASVVFDSGATAPFDVFISGAVAAHLTLPQSGEIAPPQTTAVGAQRQTYRTARLPGFNLGPVTLKDSAVAVVPMIDGMAAQVGRPVDAIVGQQFLKSRVFAIDYAARKIALRASPGDDATAIRFVLAPAKPLLLVHARINGRGPFTLQIDTGATGTSLSPDAASRADVTSVGAGVLGGAGGAVAVQVGQARVAFGPLERGLAAVAITEAMTKISAAAGTTIDGILGGDFYQDACLTIDYPGRRLWLGPAVPR